MATNSCSGDRDCIFNKASLSKINASEFEKAFEIEDTARSFDQSRFVELVLEKFAISFRRWQQAPQREKSFTKKSYIKRFPAFKVFECLDH